MTHEFPDLPDPASPNGVVASQVKTPAQVEQAALSWYVAQPHPQLIEKYELPAPLHQLNEAELTKLQDALHVLMHTWGEICCSARVSDRPGWLMLVGTEYGFVRAALSHLRRDRKAG